MSGSIGLRAQILLALSAAFIASFTLLGTATVQLTQRARSLDRYREVKESCERLAREVDSNAAGAPDRFRAMGAALVGRHGVAGLEWIRPSGRIAHGVLTGDFVESETRRPGVVRIWFHMPTPTDAMPVTNLLLLYVAITGAAVLMLTYVSLTYLIVRPLESVTHASERLARGTAPVSIPERGAAEVTRLAVSFNEMARQLREEREQLEARLKELEETTTELRSAQNQLVRSEKLASVGRLSAGVAHEIGNPLAAILGMLELLRGGSLDATEQEEFLRRIQNETERIHKIIRGLLDFSRQGQASEPADEADLGEIVEDAVRLIAPQKDLRGITIERRLTEDGVRVRGSRDQITQVVLNLLLNAADAIQGEGTIQVEVAPSLDHRRVILAVSDSGPGIDSKVMTSLFEPFVTTKPTGEGTGLGLAVCHTIVERLHGTITASNPATGGARFEVTLPAVGRNSATG
jgi:two-component system NtrC family sensor kinase